jgi:glycosyltransferase involved in cell wall biosynthesis
MRSSGPRVVMLTPDRDRIDRRILLQAKSLTVAGYQVTILGRPSLHDNQELPAEVELIKPSPKSSPRAALISALRRSYRRLQTQAALKPALWLAQRLVDSVQVHPERPFTQLFLEPAAKLRADIYVAHDLPVLPAAIEAATSNGAKVVYDAHELFPDQEFAPLLRRYWRAVERRYIQRASAVTTVNPAIAAELAACYTIAQPVVLYNSLPWHPHLESKPRLFHEALNLPPSTRTVLYQGGLVPHRNLTSLVRSMAYVQNRQVVVIFLGDGPEQKRLTRQARRLGVSDRVRFHPAVSQAHLLRYTASADLGIIPYLATSKNTKLCTPNKLFEFLQAEVPILAHDLPVLRLIIAGEGIGRVSTLSSPKSLATAVDEWFDTCGSGQSYQDALRQAKARYCWEREEQKLLTLYQSLGESAA